MIWKARCWLELRQGGWVQSSKRNSSMWGYPLPSQGTRTLTLPPSEDKEGRGLWKQNRQAGETGPRWKKSRKN